MEEPKPLGRGVKRLNDSYLCLEGVHLNCVHEISSFNCDGLKKKIRLNESTFTLKKLQVSLVVAKFVGIY